MATDQLLAFRADPDLRAVVERRARQEAVTLSDFLRRAVRRELEQAH